jgi:RNase H-fold protein (predicted Holliday junction resolvase)
MSSSNLLALDYGTKKTGIAYAVEGFSFAWKTLKTSELMDMMPKIIKEKNI